MKGMTSWLTLAIVAFIVSPQRHPLNKLQKLFPFKSCILSHAAFPVIIFTQELYLFRSLYIEEIVRFLEVYILRSQYYGERSVVYRCKISSCGFRLEGSMWTYLALVLYISMPELFTTGISCLCSRLKEIVSLVRTRLSFVWITRYAFWSSRILISCLDCWFVDLVGTVIHSWNFTFLQSWFWIVLEINVRFIVKYACREWVTLLY